MTKPTSFQFSKAVRRMSTDNWNYGGMGNKEQNCHSCINFHPVQDETVFGVCLSKASKRSGLLTYVECGCDLKDEVK